MIKINNKTSNTNLLTLKFTANKKCFVLILNNYVCLYDIDIMIA